MASAADRPPTPPDRITGPRCVVRRYTRADAPALHEAIVASTEHLRPWMAWIAHEPMTVEDRAGVIDHFTKEWDAGEDFALGIFALDDRTVLGGTGFHARLGPNAYELGYWVRVDMINQGLATEVSRMLTDAAFAVPGIDAVEIHHHIGNVRSGAVPRKLGYTRLADEPSADGPMHAIWRVDKEAWLARCATA
jgi:RimJ/RimL family protein N-acetyltransferase